MNLLEMSAGAAWMMFWLSLLVASCWFAFLYTVHAVLTNDERLKLKQHEKTKDVELAVERMKVLGSDRAGP